MGSRSATPRSTSRPPEPPPSSPARCSTGCRAFVSYRRSDEAAFAGRLYDRIAATFGPDRVFRDVDSVALGRNFLEALDRALTECSVMLVVLGKGWLEARDEHGNRRLDDPDDLVRREIEVALRRNVTMIPVLVEGAQMPHSADLPPSLASLAEQNGLNVSNASFGNDSREIIAFLDRIFGFGADHEEDRPERAG